MKNHDTRTTGRIVTGFAALICFLVPALGSPNGRFWREGPHASVGVHRTDFETFVFELVVEVGTEHPGRERLQLRRLGKSDPPVVLWEGYRGWIHSPVMRVAAGDPRSGTILGRWFHGGGTRYLHLWTFPASMKPEELRAAEPSEWEIQNVEIEGETHNDAADPFPFFFRGGLYVLGSSMTGPEGNTVWITPLPFPPGQAAKPPTLLRQPEPLQVRKVAEGAEPRVMIAEDGSGVYLTVLQRHTSGADVPVQIYRSEDLETWTLNEGLSRELRAESSYTVLLDGGTMWLATTRGGEHEVVVMRSSLDEPEWKLVELAPAAERRVRPSLDPLWLLKAPTRGGRPELVFVASDGTIAACSL